MSTVTHKLAAAPEALTAEDRDALSLLREQEEATGLRQRK